MTTPAPTPSTSIPKLHATITIIDEYAHSGFSEIAAVARLALAAFERSDGYRHPENIAQALTAIWKRADDIQNCISVEAKEAGCNWVDEAMLRRYQAYSDARQEETEGAK